jgi:hypothetical protein
VFAPYFDYSPYTPDFSLHTSHFTLVIDTMANMNLLVMVSCSKGIIFVSIYRLFHRERARIADGEGPRLCIKRFFGEKLA